MAGFSIFGALSSILENIFKTGKESASKRSIQKMRPAQLLKAHRDNFMIAYNEIVGITLTRTPQLSTNITILTGEDKFEFSSGRQYDIIHGLFKDRLIDKVTVRP